MNISLRLCREMISGYILWCFVHWSFSNLYVHLCTPCTGVGFFKTMLLVQSPQCRAISWLNNISMLSMQETFGLCVSWCMFRITNVSHSYCSEIKDNLYGTNKYHDQVKPTT